MKFHKVETVNDSALWNDWISRVVVSLTAAILRFLLGEKVFADTFPKGLVDVAAIVPPIAVGGSPKGFPLKLESKHDGEARLRECNLLGLSHLKSAFEFYTSKPITPAQKRIVHQGEDVILLSLNLSLWETMSAAFLIAANIAAPIDPSAKSPSDTPAWRRLMKAYGLPRNRRDVAAVLKVLQSGLATHEGKRTATVGQPAYHLAYIVEKALEIHGEKPWDVSIGSNPAEKKPSSKVSLSCGQEDHPSIAIPRGMFEKLATMGEAPRCVIPGCGRKLFKPSDVEITTQTVKEALVNDVTPPDDLFLQAAGL